MQFATSTIQIIWILAILSGLVLHAQNDKDFLFLKGEWKNNVVRVSGITSMDDKQHVSVYLKYQNILAGTSRANIKNGQFFGNIGPFSKPLCPGRWEISARIKKDGQEIWGYAIIKVGTVEQIYEARERSSQFLKKHVSTLESILKEIASPNIPEEGKKKAESADEKANKIKETQSLLKTILEEVEEFRNNWMKPVYPMATEVVLQMPSKLASLQDIKDNPAEKMKFEALYQEIKLNIEKAQTGLQQEEKADMQVLAKDAEILHKAYFALQENSEQFANKVHSVPRYQEIWPLWAQGWESSLLFVHENMVKYQKIDKKDKSFQQSHQNLQNALDNLKALWVLHIQGLKEKFPAIQFDPSPDMIPSQNVRWERRAQYHKDIQSAIDRLTGQVNQYKKPMEERLDKDFKTLTNWYNQLENQYVNAKSSNVKDWEKWFPEFERTISDCRRQTIEYLRPDFDFFYPAVNNLMSGAASSILSLGTEYNLDIYKKPEFSKGGHGKLHQYSRKERIRDLKSMIEKDIAQLKTILYKK